MIATPSCSSPTPWTILAPMTPTVIPQTPPRHSAIAANDALDQVLWDINLTENGRRLDGDV